MNTLIKPMVATHHLPEESLSWMLEARRVFGELEIFIDANRVTPGTEARAQSVATGVHYSKVDHLVRRRLGCDGRGVRKRLGAGRRLRRAG